MADVVLHIGGFKTGTSYIQSLFHQNRGELAKRSVFYPDFAYGNAHHALTANWNSAPEALTGAARAGSALKLWDQLIQDYGARPGILFLSSELFSHPDISLKELKNLLEQFESTRIVYTMRRQAELAQSVWLQLARSGKWRALHAFVRTALEHRAIAGVTLDHLALYRRLVRVFSPTQIHVLNFHSLSRQTRGLERALLSLCGICLSELDLIPPKKECRNISPDPLAYYMATRLDPRPDDHLIETVMQAVRQGKPENSPTSLLARHEFFKFQSRFEKRNEALAHRLRPYQKDFSFSEAPPPAQMIFREDADTAPWIFLASYFLEQSQSIQHPGPIQILKSRWGHANFSEMP